VLETAVRGVYNGIDIPFGEIGGYEPYGRSAEQFFKSIHAAPPKSLSYAIPADAEPREFFWILPFVATTG
jgi:hypothetical protein